MEYSEGPILTLVNDTLCSGLAVDSTRGDLYWTASTGHPLRRLSYSRYNWTAAALEPTRPVYSISYP
eukprot:3910352-Prymnesium_polylepis.1